MKMQCLRQNSLILSHSQLTTVLWRRQILSTHFQATFGWDDVGSWLAVGRIKKNDDNSNVINGNVVAVNTRGCVIEGGEKLIATVGLRDIVVVDTKDATLITTKENAGEIKQVLAKLREEGKNEYL